MTTNDTATTAARDRVLLTAISWWRAKMPIGWSEDEHLATPFVNCTSDELDLAQAVAQAITVTKIMTLLGKKE